MNSDVAISLSQVTKILGTIARADALSFTCEVGSIYGLLGPNGAGKTTLMNLITGLYRPTTGSVRVFGLDPVKDATQVRRLIGLVPQETSLYPELNAVENLRFHAALYLNDYRQASRRIGEVLELVDLADRAKEPVGNYSGGMKRRLAIGRALLSDPKLLLLDEPTLGVDVQGTHRIWDYISRFKSEGRTVLVSTNVMAEADTLADRILLLDYGKLVRFDTPANLKAELGHSTIRLVPAPEATINKKLMSDKLGEYRLEDGAIVMNAPGGESDLASALSALGGAIALDGIELHRPTLDDVFLSLTGRSLRD